MATARSPFSPPRNRTSHLAHAVAPFTVRHGGLAATATMRHTPALAIPENVEFGREFYRAGPVRDRHRLVSGVRFDVPVVCWRVRFEKPDREALDLGGDFSENVGG